MRRKRKSPSVDCSYARDLILPGARYIVDGSIECKQCQMWTRRNWTFEPFLFLSPDQKLRVSNSHSYLLKVACWLFSYEWGLSWNWGRACAWAYVLQNVRKADVIYKNHYKFRNSGKEEFFLYLIFCVWKTNSFINFYLEVFNFWNLKEWDLKKTSQKIVRARIVEMNDLENLVSWQYTKTQSFWAFYWL